MPETVYRSVGVTTSTAVIWLRVSVPVLSELIAEVKPSVSTDGRSFTIALRLARSMPPSDRMVWVTVGSASGMVVMFVLGRIRDQAWDEHHDHRQAGREADPQGE